MIDTVLRPHYEIDNKEHRARETADLFMILFLAKASAPVSQNITLSAIASRQYGKAIAIVHSMR